MKPRSLGRVLDFVVPLLVAMWTCWSSSLITAVVQVKQFRLGTFELLALKIVTAAVIIGMFARPVRCGLSLGAFAMVSLDVRAANERLSSKIATFSALSASHDRKRTSDRDDTYNALIHGDIDHGWQSIDKRRREPLTYFHPKGGIGQVFQKFSWYGCKSEEFAWPDDRLPGFAGRPRYFAAGLDLADAAATQSEPAYGWSAWGSAPWPLMPSRCSTSASTRSIRSWSTYRFRRDGAADLQLPEDARDRGSDIKVVLGDGRLTLEKDTVQGYYHILVLDAFSSDAIPVHLLTREAMDMYLVKLAEGGLLVFNTSNRHVDISGVLADLAHDLDLSCYSYSDTTDKARFPTKIGTELGSPAAQEPAQ